MENDTYGMDSFDSKLNNGTIYKANLAQANSYKFESFDPVKELNEVRNFSMIISSKRRTGKSVFMRDICHKIKNWYLTAYIFSMTSDLQPDMYDFVPPKNVFGNFNEAKLEEIWDRQEKLILSLKKIKAKEEDMPHILIILDDIISDPKVRKSEILNRYFVAGRHIKMAVIVLSQTFTGVPPILRTNCDISVAFYLDSQDNRESYAKQYISTKNKNLGIMIFEKITKEPYQCIVCLNCLTSQDPQKTVRIYSAKLKVPKFKIGKNDVKNLYILDSLISSESTRPFELNISKKGRSTIHLK